MNARGYLLLLALGAFIYIVLIISIGVYYENGSNTYIALAVAGNLFHEPTGIPVSVAAHCFLSYGYAWLYSVAPAVPWYDLLMSLYTLLSFIFLVVTLHALQTNGLSHNRKENSHIIIAIIIAIGLIFQNFLLIEFTRISIVIIYCSGLLLLLYNKVTYKTGALLNIFLILGMLIRPDSFAYAVILLLPLVLLIIPFWRTKRLTSGILIFIGLSICLNYPLTQQDQKYLEIRPFQLNLFDYNTDLGKKNFDTRKDSIALFAAQSAFLNDQQVIDKKLLKKYVLSIDKTPYDWQNYLQANKISLKEVISSFKKVPNGYWWFWLIVVTTFLITTFKNRQTLWKGGLIFLYYFTVFLSTAIFLKMETHVFYPTIVCLVVGLIATSFPWCSKNKKMVVSSLLFLLFISTNFYLYMKKDLIVNTRNDRIHELNRTIDKKADRYSQKVFIYNLKSLTSLNLRLFHPKDDLQSNSFSFDNGFLYLSNVYEKRANELFSTTNTPQIVETILQKPDKYLFISTIERITLLQEYFAVVHDIHFNYRVLEPSSSNLNESLPALIKITNSGKG